MEEYHLAFFILNIVLVLVDAALGYHFAPQLVAGMVEPESIESNVRATRRILPFIVALYMFFNCIGYFQNRSAYLYTVTGLVLVDIALQFALRRKKQNEPDEEESGRGNE